MNLHDIFCRKFCWKQKKKVFTRDDCTESDLIQYSLDHLETSKKLYSLSRPMTWKYLHSAAYLSHLSIELILKACLLHLEGKFLATHDLKWLFRRLSGKGIELSRQNQEWLRYLDRFNGLRYPDLRKGPEVDIIDWERTKTLFDELRKHVPNEIRNLIVQHERYRSNVKSGKTI